MTHWNESAVTETGAEMLNEVVAGRFLTVTAAYGGTGLVDAGELAKQTGLLERKQTLSIISDELTGEGRTVTVQITNADAEYELNQIGIYARLDADRDPEAPEQLLCLMQDRQERGAIIVPSTDDPAFVLEVYCVIKLTSDGRVKVTIDQTGIVNIAYMEKRLSAHDTDPSSHDDIRQRIINDDLLINSYFVGGGSQLGAGKFPINQRGQTEYIGNGYTIDRWKGNFIGFSASVVEGGVYLDIPSTGYLNQKIENVIALAGKTVTCSALVKNGINIRFRFRINGIVGDSGSYTDVNGNGLFSFTYTLPEDLESLDVEFGTSNNNAFSGLLVSAKLELGPVQTLAHKEGDEWVLNEIPNFAEQYAICEQYSPITGEFVGSQHSNPNLLDNWYFIGGGSQQGGGQFPINQRGETEYAGSIYGIDRWKNSAANITSKLTSDGIEIYYQTTTNQRQGIIQIMEDSFLDYSKGKTFTFSAIGKAISGQWIVGVRTTSGINFESPYSKADDYELSTLTFTVPENATTLQIFLCATANSSFVVKAAKLELGPVQTLAHKEGDEWVLNEIPNFAEQFDICSQYDPDTGVFTGNLANAVYPGRVKLSDDVDSTSGVSGGVAATPAAVKKAYDLADTKAPNYKIGILSDYTGEDDLTVNLERKPKMVIVGNRLGFTNIIVTNGSNTHPGHTVAMPDYPGYISSICTDMAGTKVLEVTATGFTISKGMESPLAPFFYLALF